MAISIRKNYIYNLLLNISSVVFPLITAPYIARVLGPNAIGLAGFAITYVGYFTLIAKLGSETYGQRQVARLRDNKKDVEVFISEMTSISIINTLLLSIVYIASILFIPKFFANYIVFFIAGFSLFLRPLDTLNWYFKGTEQFGFTVSRSFAIKIITIIALFLFVKSESDLNIYVGLDVLASFGVIFSNIYYIKKDGIRIRWTRHGLIKHYKPLFILFTSSIAISIYTMLDRLMLGLMSSYSEVSYYGYATTFNKMLLSIVTSLSVVALPRMAYYFKNKDSDKINDLMGKSIDIVSFLAIPMALGITCIAPVFVPLFLGDSFQPAVMPTMIMSGVIIAIGFNNLLGIQVLISLGFDKQFLYCVLVGTVSNFLLNLLLIPKLGANGAATSSVVAETLILIAEISYVKKYTLVKFNGGINEVWKSLSGASLFIPIAYLLFNILSGWIYIATLIVICICVYTLSQYLLRSKSLKLLAESINIFSYNK